MKKCGFITIVGAPNIGKSTLFNALIGEKLAPVTHKPQTTKRKVRGILTKDDAQFVFIDSAGILKPNDGIQSQLVRDANESIAEADVLLVMVKAQKPFIDSIVESSINKFKGPKILLINQVDLIKDKAELFPILEKFGQESSNERNKFDVVIPISAKKKSGLEGLMGEVAKLLPEREFLYGEDELTDANERELVAELVREQMLLLLGQEVPYKSGVSIDKFDESRREGSKNSNKKIISIDVTIHVERDSQKAIVLGRGGSHIKKIGMGARLEMEKLLGCKVMLKTHVKVSPNWTARAEALGIF